MSTDFYMAENSKTPMFWIFPWWNLTTPCLPFYCGFTLDRGRHSGVEFGLTTRIFWRGFMPMGSSLSQRTLLLFNLKLKLMPWMIFMLIFILFVWSGIQALLKGINALCSSLSHWVQLPFNLKMLTWMKLSENVKLGQNLMTNTLFIYVFCTSYELEFVLSALQITTKIISCLWLWFVHVNGWRMFCQIQA